jgi:8-oxo-dGTP pyrophosphatase MutT (NUDIX family)
LRHIGKDGANKSDVVPRNSHCSSCGAAYPGNPGWPRTCASCGDIAYGNPLPVAVLVQPIEDDGVLVIRRGIPPVGKLALPGGFIDHAEAWRAAAARELREEAQVVIDPDTIRELRVLSADDGSLLVFGVAPPLREADLPPFTPNEETQDRLVIHAFMELAFPLHTQVLREWYEGRRKF